MKILHDINEIIKRYKGLEVEVDEDNLFCPECYERYVKYGFMDPRD